MVNFPEQEYTDVFGGTKGKAALEEIEKYKYDIRTGTSAAEVEYLKTKRKESLKTLAEEVDAINKKEE